MPNAVQDILNQDLVAGWAPHVLCSARKINGIVVPIISVTGRPSWPWDETEPWMFCAYLGPRKQLREMRCKFGKWYRKHISCEPCAEHVDLAAKVMGWPYVRVQKTYGFGYTQGLAFDKVNGSARITVSQVKMGAKEKSLKLVRDSTLKWVRLLDHIPAFSSDVCEAELPSR